ncbi:MAG TPA: beta-L-arabinofuranosidase domain-containing protein, partial [Gemmatimonadaceae bacterium]|nr:beta-L-arabinofuranosidase domain-containing protein [Gemmatimonadaceae bacterium]
MYQATGDGRFKQRADYLVAELAEVQKKQQDGYLSALEGGREAFARLSHGEIKSAAFDLNGLWSPWYTLHKTFAGLRDAYRHANNRTALEVETRFAEWARGVLAPLNDEQVARMLNTEHGGMNEVLADLYVDTGDARWLALSRRFEHHAFTDALARGQDNLPGKHVNCQIPKLIGSAARYEYTGDAADLMTASFFWDRVAQHHSYATGGQGLDEYFGYPDRLSQRVDGRAAESCCVYNMLKLTRRLFSLRPDAFYADYHERMLFNHALASFDPDRVRMSYMVPVGRAEEQEYQDMLEDFTCCVGTGMENHALHGDGIYYESADTVWANLFAPSTAELRNGVRLAMDSDFPDGDHAKVTISGHAAHPFALAIRRPGWAGDGFAVTVNGERIDVPTIASLRPGGAGGRDLGLDEGMLPPSSFVTIERAWKAGDVVDLTIPKTLRLEPTDDPRVAAIIWGPLVLAGDLGPRRERAERRETPTPTSYSLVAFGRPLNEWVVPAAERTGDFTARGVARALSKPNDPAGDLSLAPFYRTQERTYSVYFDVLTPVEFDAQVAARAAVAERQHRLELATVTLAQPGNAADEQKFKYQSEPADRVVTRTDGRTGRGGTGWFSFDLPLESAAESALVVTYHNDLGLPFLANFEIQVDGSHLARYQPNHSATAFWDDTYALPPAMIAGKSKITVRFQAGSDSRIAPVYGVRITRVRVA